ncbi:MAG: class I SAM-dependent methyltransferase [Candidatus Omnitrophica bacterium]|nr:class I SAM-dependent methyltransferase [Candidatus Omnitrophota bacterium]MCX6726971.1 class I SAM-dependent methyltransferase [Candidatus Shapirobacteria bacterium]
MMTVRQNKIGVWTPEIISRFWNYAGKQSGSQEQCFSKQVGKGLVKFLRDTVRLHDGMSVLDFGCGPGFLIQHLLEQKVICYGVDSSPELVELVNQRFQGYQRWMGATVAFSQSLPYPDSSFDLVTCVEVFEHLLDDNLHPMLFEIYRVLKPGGVAMFTTPNMENLLVNQVFCPFCQTEFHNRQHVRSFCVDSMHKLIQSVGFKVLFCEGVNFTILQNCSAGWKDSSLRNGYYGIRLLKGIILDRILSRSFPYSEAFRVRAGCGIGAPHLCAIVERPKYNKISQGNIENQNGG